MKIYQRFASLLSSIKNCKASGNQTWEDRHGDHLDRLLKALPTGSGINAGIQLNNLSTEDKLIFHADFHHMSEHGYYTGWTKHTIIITPSLASGFNIKVTGRDKNGIKEYLGDLFYQELNEEEPSAAAIADSKAQDAYRATHAAALP